MILFNVRVKSLLPAASAYTGNMGQRRCMTSHEITKNIRLYTEEQRKIEADPKTLRYASFNLQLNIKIDGSRNIDLEILISLSKVETRC